MPIMMSTKGRAAMIVICCRPVSESSPPIVSMIAAAAPVATPQKITVNLLGSRVPRSLSEPMTIEAASAPDTKKIATSTMTRIEVTPAHGIESSSAKSVLSSPSPNLSSVAPISCALIAAPPKIANHTRLTVLGTRSTPVTNSRMVRPREMRAMNMPTKGVQLTHHAQ